MKIIETIELYMVGIATFPFYALGRIYRTIQVAFVAGKVDADEWLNSPIADKASLTPQEPRSPAKTKEVRI